MVKSSGWGRTWRELLFLFPPLAVSIRRSEVILAIDGLQPDVGHEVLWVLVRYLTCSFFSQASTFHCTRLQDDSTNVILLVIDGGSS